MNYELYISVLKSFRVKTAQLGLLSDKLICQCSKVHHYHHQTLTHLSVGEISHPSIVRQLQGSLVISLSEQVFNQHSVQSSFVPDLFVHIVTVL